MLTTLHRRKMTLAERLLLLGRDGGSDDAAPWTPLSLPHLVCWADAAAIGGADGDPVAAWPDGSGAGNHFAQATTSRRPVFHAAQAGSEPAVVFDGADDFLATAAPVMSATGGDCAIWAVAYTETDSTTSSCFLATGYDSGVGLTADGGAGLGGLFGAVAWIGDGTDARGRWLFFVCRRSGGATNFTVNGYEVIDYAAHVPIMSATQTLLGCHRTDTIAHCRIAQAGFIDGALSDPDMALLSTYIAGRYGALLDGSGL